MHLEVERPEPNVAARDDRVAQREHHLAASPGRRQAQPQLPRVARLLDLLQPGQLALGDGCLGAGPLGALHLPPPDRLVVVRGAARVRRPGGTGAGPLALPAGPVDQALPGGRVLPVRLLGSGPGGRPLVQVGLPAAAELDQAVAELVDLDHPVDGAGQELAVVRDQHQRSGVAADQALASRRTTRWLPAARARPTRSPDAGGPCPTRVGAHRRGLVAAWSCRPRSARAPPPGRRSTRSGRPGPGSSPPRATR